MQAIITQLEAILKTESADPNISVRDALQTLDSILKDDGEKLAPKLKHYLEKRSYVKALNFLQGNEEE